MPSLNGEICRYEKGNILSVHKELNEDECLFLFFSHVLMNSPDVRNSDSFDLVKQLVDKCTCLQTIALASVERFHPTPSLLEKLQQMSGEEEKLNLNMIESFDLCFQQSGLHNLLIPNCNNEQFLYKKIRNAGMKLLGDIKSEFEPH